MSRLTRDGTAGPVSRDQILRHAGTGEYSFSLFSCHEQDWQPYPVDPYSALFDDHTYIHTYILYQYSFTSLMKKRNTTTTSTRPNHTLPPSETSKPCSFDWQVVTAASEPSRGRLLLAALAKHPGRSLPPRALRCFGLVRLPTRRQVLFALTQHVQVELGRRCDEGDENIEVQEVYHGPLRHSWQLQCLTREEVGKNMPIEGSAVQGCSGAPATPYRSCDRAKNEYARSVSGLKREGIVPLSYISFIFLTNTPRPRRRPHPLPARKHIALISVTHRRACKKRKWS